MTKFSLIALIALVALTSAGCSNDGKQFAATTDRIAGYVSTGLTLVDQQTSTGLMSRDTGAVIVVALRSVNTLNAQVIEEGKRYVFVNGAFEEEKEDAVTEETTEEVTEEVVEKEEEMATEEGATPEENVEVEAAVDPAADAEAILAIGTPRLEEKIAEVLQVIADLKNEMTESEDEAPSEEVEMNLSATQRFTNVTKFLKGK